MIRLDVLKHDKMFIRLSKGSDIGLVLDGLNVVRGSKFEIPCLVKQSTLTVLSATSGIYDVYHHLYCYTASNNRA